MRIAVIGLGSIGMRHSRNLLSLGESVIGFDPDAARRALLETAGGEVASTREGVLERADAAVIASPNACHADDLAAATQAGLNAFVEKPLATSLERIDSILESAEAAGRIVFVGFNLRFHPCVRRALALIREGRLGELLWARFQVSSYLPDWRKGQDHRAGYAADPVSGGVMFDSIHEVDLAIHLAGPGVTAAAAALSTGRLGIPSEDLAVLAIRHANGALSSVHVDYLTRPSRRCAEVAGSEGVLELDLLARRLVLREASGETAVSEAFTGSFDDDYVDEMSAFLSCVRGGREDYCSGREAMDSLRAVLSAREMSRPGEQ